MPHQPDHLSFRAYCLPWGRAFFAICTVAETLVSWYLGPFGLCRAAAQGSPPPGAGSFPCGSLESHTRSLPCPREEGSPGPPGALLHPAHGHSQAGFPLRPRAAHCPHSAARPSQSAEGRHYPAQTSFLTSPQYCFPPIARLCSGDRAKANLPAVAEASTEARSWPSLHPRTPGLQRGSQQPTATPARANPPCVEEGLEAAGTAHPSPSHFSSAARPWARSHSC